MIFLYIAIAIVVFFALIYVFLICPQKSKKTEEFFAEQKFFAHRGLHGGGVPLIASAHAADLSDLLLRRGIAELHRAGVFGAYVEVDRSREPPYLIHSREECHGF